MGALLCPSDFDAQFFGKALSDFFRQPVMYSSCAFFGGIEHRNRGRSRHRDTKPDKGRKRESRECRNFQHERMARPKISDYPESQQEDSGRY